MEMRAEHRAHFNSSPKTAAFQATPLLGGFKIAARDVHVLTYLGEDDGQTCVLADGGALFHGDVRVPDELVEHVASRRGKFAFSGVAHGLQHGFRKAAAGFYGQSCHGVAYEVDGNFSHDISRMREVGPEHRPFFRENKANAAVRRDFYVVSWNEHSRMPGFFGMYCRGMGKGTGHGAGTAMAGMCALTFW